MSLMKIELCHLVENQIKIHQEINELKPTMLTKNDPDDIASQAELFVVKSMQLYMKNLIEPIMKERNFLQKALGFSATWKDYRLIFNLVAIEIDTGLREIKRSQFGKNTLKVKLFAAEASLTKAIVYLKEQQENTEQLENTLCFQRKVEGGLRVFNQDFSLTYGSAFVTDSERNNQDKYNSSYLPNLVDIKQKYKDGYQKIKTKYNIFHQAGLLEIKEKYEVEYQKQHAWFSPIKRFFRQPGRPEEIQFIVDVEKYLNGNKAGDLSENQKQNFRANALSLVRQKIRKERHGANSILLRLIEKYERDYHLHMRRIEDFISQCEDCVISVPSSLKTMVQREEKRRYFF